MENYIMGCDISTMKELKLFDDIPYKYIKDVINDDTENNRYPLALEVVIEELPTLSYALGGDAKRYKFTFLIPQLDDEGDGKEFIVIKEYKYKNEMEILIKDIGDDE